MSTTMTAAITSTDDAIAAAQAKLAPIRELYAFQSHFIRQGELLQHYIDEGPRDGSPLLFLHGNPTWSFLWRDLVRDLSSDYRCIAPDHIGCGLSDKPQDWGYRLADHAENVLRLVEKLDLKRVTLVVHDWGGAIGFAMARRAPERIARVVVMNTAAFRAPKIPLRIAVCRTPLLGKLAVRGLNAFAKAATVMTTVRPLSKAIKRGFLLPYDSWNTRVATHEFVEDIPIKPGHRSWDELVATDEALAGFTDRPMAIFWGEHDWCFSLDFRAEWQRRFPAARVHNCPDAGRYLREDAGEEILGKLRAFLGETGDAGAGERPGVPAQPTPARRRGSPSRDRVSASSRGVREFRPCLRSRPPTHRIARRSSTRMGHARPSVNWMRARIVSRAACCNSDYAPAIAAPSS